MPQGLSAQKSGTLEFCAPSRTWAPRKTVPVRVRVRSIGRRRCTASCTTGVFVVHTPNFNGQDCEARGRDVQGDGPWTSPIPPAHESGSVDFDTDFFGTRSLTVSGQLNGETFALAFRGRVHLLGPTSAPRRVHRPPRGGSSG